MERKNQKLEFAQKFNAKSAECMERHSNNCFSVATKPMLSASGGDIGQPLQAAYSGTKKPSFQTLNYQSEEHYEEDEREKGLQSDESNEVDFGCSSKLRAELSEYKKELKMYNKTTKDLEEQYLKINLELSEMQQKHDRFVAKRNSNVTNNSDSCSDSSSTLSEFSLQRKHTQVFHRGSSFMTMLPKPSAKSISDYALLTNGEYKDRRKPKNFDPVRDCQSRVTLTSGRRHGKRRQPDNKENEAPPLDGSYVNKREKGLNDNYKVFRNVLDTKQTPQQQTGHKLTDELSTLQATISILHSDQQHLRHIIEQQQVCLNDYHSRCVRAQHIMQRQQVEIEKLNSNNQQLEAEITSGYDQLRLKIDAKLREMSQLPQLMREEQSKHIRVAKENSMLTERLRLVQAEANQLKKKMEELGQRKMATLNRLKVAERDLKIFKNYNVALKNEKRKLNEDLQKLREQLDSVESFSKRTLSRQREQGEKQRRELQKRVLQLELKLNRSQNSTTNLIQERDNLIAELQTQLNTLVHNFEVSQKHIRVLRRHIYSMTSGNTRSSSRILNEAV